MGVFNDYFTKLLNNDEISTWLYFIPIAVFFTGLWNILNYFNNRKKQYKDLAKATIIKSIVTAVVQLCVGFIKQGATGLVSGQLLSQFFANTKLLRNIMKDKILISKISKVKIIALAKRYKKFPKYSMWSIFFNTSSTQLPIVLLTSFFTSSVTGYFSLAQRILTLPMNLIGSSIGQVFLEKASKMKNDKKAVFKLTIKTIKKLSLIGIIPLGIIGLYGDSIFGFVFGDKWTIAGEYAQILSIWLFVVFILSPVSTILIVYEKQKESLIFDFSIFISRLLVICIGYYFFNDSVIVIWLYSLVGLFFWIGLLLYILKILNINKN